ncbi:MAG: HlyC/CorC family transporter [Ruminococcus sp.]|nr:HlyC/CorC family transporter [Ruminococcus sp.]
MYIYLVLILLLIACSSLFSACETAFSGVNKIRLKHRAKNGDRSAAKALAIAERFDRALTAILIGNNLVNIASASIGTILFTKWFGESGVGISSLVMTVLVLIFGEILPKSYAKSHADDLAMLFAAPLQGLMWLLTPVIWMFQLLARLVQNKNADPSVTEDELKVIVEQIEEEGVLEEQESDLVRSALDFDEISVSEVLVPRVNVTAIERDMPLADIKELFLRERYSRLPVYNETMDDIVGFITDKDFFALLESHQTSIGGILQEIPRLPEFERISDALRKMQRAKAHMAVVVDQYGGTKGIVTLEDILEELVGEIYDEADEVVQMIVPVTENVFDIAGECSIAQLREQFSLADDTPVTECTSVGGWITEQLGHIAAVGECCEGEWFSAVVTAVQEQKLRMVRLTLKSPAEEEA